MLARLGIFMPAHVSVRGDELNKTVHEHFITTHLGGGMLALAAMPVYLGLVAIPDAVELALIGLLSLPVVISWFVSRTGKLFHGNVASVMVLVMTVSLACLFTGGLGSFLVAWFLVIPFEAAGAGNRRLVGFSIGCVAAVLIGLGGLQIVGMLPDPRIPAFDPAILYGIGIVSALIYAGSIAWGIQSFYTTSASVHSTRNRHYEMLAGNGRDLITRHLDDGSVVFVSPASQPMLGVAPQNLLKDGLIRRVHPADRAKVLQAFAQVLKQQINCMVECRLRQSLDQAPSEGVASAYLWVEVQCLPIGDELQLSTQDDYAKQGFVAITSDISKRKDHELALEAACREAEEANLSKSRFLASMSHELRTPLNAINGFSELIKHQMLGPGGQEKYTEYAGLIHESGIKLLNILNDLLDMAKLEVGHYDLKPGRINGFNLLQSCEQVMAGTARDHEVTLILSEPSRPILFEGDERAVKQMLLHVLSNAIKFNKPGGKVSFGTRPLDEDRVELWVEDTGIGIPESDLDRLTRPFEQMGSIYNRQHEGRGLGLAILAGLVRLHSGTVKIRSVEQEGTRVSVRLPVKFTPAQEEPRAITTKAADENLSSAA